ncbi:hypothetical protein [Nocardia xishanensis]|uniref:hypothetical protein n=1 Tax=Nocardia xishanensis TaxID=238964 RepID=UPI00341B26EB
MSRMLTKTLAAVALSAGLSGLSLCPAQAAPATAEPAAADTQTGSASGSALLAWPIGFLAFAACFADGDSQVHNPLCQTLLALYSGSTGSPT